MKQSLTTSASPAASSASLGASSTSGAAGTSSSGSPAFGSIAGRKLPRQGRHHKGRLRGGIWLRQKRQGRHLAKALMGPLGVVGVEPRVGDGADILERAEEIRVQDLLAKRPVEALSEGVLIGLAGLNVAEADSAGLYTTRRRLRRRVPGHCRRAPAPGGHRAARARPTPE